MQNLSAPAMVRRILGGVLSVPLVIVLWRLDPFRIRRLSAAVAGLACLASLVAFATTYPNEAWQGYYNDGYVSKFMRSGVNAVSDYMQYGFMESGSDNSGSSTAYRSRDSCHPAGSAVPNIILVHDESSYDIRSAPGIKVPPGYGNHFLSYDGKARRVSRWGRWRSSWSTPNTMSSPVSRRDLLAASPIS